jgi:DME family drug/metabolite transporter
VATLNLAEPVVATILGVVVLGEILTGWGWIGCLIIVAALALLGLSERDRVKVPIDGTMVK